MRSWVHPQVDSKEKGREGSDKFWVAHRGVGSAAWLWRDVLTKVLEVFWLGSLSVKANTAVSLGKGSTELCLAGLEKCSRLVTTAFSEKQLIWNKYCGQNVLACWVFLRVLLILSHPFLTPSNIFRFASGSALLLQCSPNIPAFPFSYSSHQRKEITAGYETRSSRALVFIMPEVWEVEKAAPGLLMLIQNHTILSHLKT